MGSFSVWVTFLGFLPSNLATKAASRGGPAISGTRLLSSHKLVAFFRRIRRDCRFYGLTCIARDQA